MLSGYGVYLTTEVYIKALTLESNKLELCLIWLVTLIPLTFSNWKILAQFENQVSDVYKA